MHREGTTLHHPFKPMPAYGALNSSFTVNGVVHDPLTGLDTGSGNDRITTGLGEDNFTTGAGGGPNGFSEVEIHFATPLQENCANGTFLHEGQQGFSEVEVHFEYNVGSTSGPGGTSYMTGVDHLGQFGHEADRFTNFVMPVGDFI